MNNISPLRYPGGKTRACKKLDEIFKNNFDVDSIECIISPFFGGGSFELFLQNKYNYKIIANDKFNPLYNFWTSCKVSKEQLCKLLYNKIDSINKEIFTDIRKEIMQETDLLKQSCMYFIINRCSFSGATLSGGFSQEASKKRFTKSSIDRINNLDLSNIDFYNYDFTYFLNDFLESYDNTLIFLDPPYYLEKKSKLYGNNGDMHERFNHEELFNCISTKKNWIMTYNNCAYIRDLYSDFTIIETNWSYGMNKTKQSSEIVIISRP